MTDPIEEAVAKALLSLARSKHYAGPWPYEEGPEWGNGEVWLEKARAAIRAYEQAKGET